MIYRRNYSGIYKEIYILSLYCDSHLDKMKTEEVGPGRCNPDEYTYSHWPKAQRYEKWCEYHCKLAKWCTFYSWKKGDQDGCRLFKKDECGKFDNDPAFKTVKVYTPLSNRSK